MAVRSSQAGAHVEHSLWLVPAEPLKSRLRRIIFDLAKTYGAVEFEPHVTVSCGESTDLETQAIASQIASQFSTVDLSVQRLDYTDIYTKTLFVQFNPSELAQRMADTIKALCSRSSGYVFDPHLSLLYKRLPAATQETLRRSLDVPKGLYTFDRLQAIETELPLSEPDQIKRWRTVFECDLTPSSSIRRQSL